MFVPSRGAAAPIKVLESSRGLRVGELRTTPPLQNAPLYCTAATTAQCERFQSPRHRGGGEHKHSPTHGLSPGQGHSSRPTARPAPAQSAEHSTEPSGPRGDSGSTGSPGKEHQGGGARSPHSHSEGPGLLGGGAHRRAGVGAVAGTALRQQLRVHSSCQPCQAMQAHDACLSPRHQPATRLQVGAEAHLEQGGVSGGSHTLEMAQGAGLGGEGGCLTLCRASSCRRSRLSSAFPSCLCMRRMGSRLGKFLKLRCEGGVKGRQGVGTP